MQMQATKAISPDAFGESLSGPPVLDHRIDTPTSMLVRRWQNMSPELEQPPLAAHYLLIHLGGPKRVHRKGDGSRRTVEVTPGAFSIIPAGAGFEWETEGPVEFAHCYFDHAALSQVTLKNHDRDSRDLSLSPALGVRDELTECLVSAILSEAASADGELRYMQELQNLLLHRVLRCHSTLSKAQFRSRYALAPHRLRRALDFVESNLAADIGLHEIAEAVGLSAFHFGRAFRKEMGVSPYAYLIRRRVAHARKLLGDPTLALPVVARQCGFNSHSQFSRSFKRDTGVTPNGYRSLQ